jgi:hypothetical protein
MVLQNVSNYLPVKMAHLKRWETTCPNMLNKYNLHYLARVNEGLKMLHVDNIWVTSKRLINTLQ